jgi:UDP-N-acetyl-D-glucosamine dehydrogenase
MPEYIVLRLEDVFKKNKIDLRKSKILIAGVTYKRDVLDLRKSPALDIIEILQKKGVSLSYSDPLVPYLKLNHINLKSVKLDKGILPKFDCILITSDHTCVDYGLILKYSRLIFDTRNVYKGLKNKKIFKL